MVCVEFHGIELDTNTIPADFGVSDFIALSNF